MRLLLAVFLLLYNVGIVSSNTTLPTSQYLALQDLYNATNGTSWSWKNVSQYGPKWFDTSPYPCNTPEWQGLTCDCDSSNNCDIFTMSLSNYSMFGTIPSSIGEFTYLNSLDLSDNQLYSSLPSSFVNLQFIQEMILTVNRLSGTLSDEIFMNKTQLIYFDCSINKFNGSLPLSIGSMKSLQYFDISYNSIIGSLPDSIGNLTELNDLRIASNNFNGSLPDSFYNLQSLKGCYLADNFFSGSLKVDFGQLTKLEILQIQYNEFAGTISHTIGNLQQLLLLYMYFNRFNGTIPLEIYTLTNLTGLILDNNRLTGSISKSIGNLTSLEHLSLNYNLLTGSIPNTIGNLTHLSNIELNNSSFTGTIPNDICKCRLVVLYLEINYFSGTVPSCFFEGLVSSISVHDNAFTGSLPSSVDKNFVSMDVHNNFLTGKLPSQHGYNLTFIDADNNSFTGTIPLIMFNAYVQQLALAENFLTGSFPELNNTTTLLYLAVSNNLLSGNINTLGVFPLLEVFFVNNNLFGGPITFIDENLQYLTNINLSSNQFTGTIPDSIFSIPSLGTFAAVSNCLTGSLSDSICNADLLTAVALDGLHTASSCRITMLPLISSSYSLAYYTPGSIPRCLFNMSNLNTLHAGGNGILASLPSDLILGSAINDLSLSHNQLTGTVPVGIGNNVFSSLDLSYNRLAGQLPRGPILDNMTLYYDVNRLTGPIPAEMENVETIDILNGNHFSCRSGRHTIPHNDPQHKYYECGTNTVQYTMYTWGGLFTILLVLIVIVYQSQRFNVLSALNLAEVLKTLESYFSIYKNDNCELKESIQYIIRFSILMKSLLKVLLIISSCLLLFVLPCNVILSVLYSTYRQQYAWIAGSLFLSGMIATIVLFIILVTFIAIVLFSFDQMVKDVETRITTLKMDFLELNGKQRYVNYWLLFLSGVFNFAVILTANIIFVTVVTRYGGGIVAITELWFAAFKLFWNDFVVRRLTALIHNRYRKSIKEISVAEEEYWQRIYLKLNLFNILVNVLLIPCLATAAASPECFYNVLIPPAHVVSSFNFKTCSSYLPELELITGQCEAYVTLPATTSYLPPYLYDYQCSSTLVTTYAVVYLYKFIFIAFGQPLLLVLESYCTPTKWRRITQRMLPRIYRMDVHDISKQDSFIFRKERFVLRLIMDLSILVTFGTIFPPLGLAACVAVVVQSCLVLANIGRLVNKWQVSIENSEKIIMLNNNCFGVDILLKQTLPVLGPAACIFYSFIIFDTYGNEVGGFHALPVGIAMFICGIFSNYFSSVVINGYNSFNRLRTHKPNEMELYLTERLTTNPVHEDNA